MKHHKMRPSKLKSGEREKIIFRYWSKRTRPDRYKNHRRK